MAIVIDAKIAVHWTIASRYSADAERLIASKTPLIAPDLIVPEVTNALFYAVRERADRVQRALDGLEFLPRWFAELVPTAPLRYRAMAIAMDMQHPVYDCFYLALAVERATRLVTTDEKLIAKATGSSSYGSVLVHLENFFS